MTAAILAVTPDAATQMKTMLTQAGDGASAIRVGVKARGCSGMMYFMEYATESEPGDEIVEQDGVTLYVDPQSIMHILGTTINYVSNDIEEGFTFDNPNVRSSCGCGESFGTEASGAAGHSH
jgi:iron-sulfur cluster assembly accessory protein